MKLLILFGLITILLSGCAQTNTDTQANDQGQEQAVTNPQTVPGEEGPEVIVEDPQEETPPGPEEIPEPDLEPILVNDKTVEERLEIAYTELHNPGSSHQIFNDFPDVEIVFTDDEPSSFFPPDIRPFNYHYSAEADRTFNICGINRTVFICKGKFDRLLTIEDVDDGTCEITPIYLEDPRLGGSGNLDYDYN